MSDSYVKILAIVAIVCGGAALILGISTGEGNWWVLLGAVLAIAGGGYALHREREASSEGH